MNLKKHYEFTEPSPGERQPFRIIISFSGVGKRK